MKARTGGVATNGPPLLREHDGPAGLQLGRACLQIFSGAALLLLVAVPLLADGGTLRVANAAIGIYRVNVFTAPTPILPDSIDVSVLVTFEKGRELVPGLEIRVEGHALDGQGPPVSHAATKDEAQDPRYYAAKFALGAPGAWRITVHVKGPGGEGEVSFEVKAQEPGLLANPFLVLGLAFLPLLLVGYWLRTSGTARTPSP